MLTPTLNGAWGGAWFSAQMTCASKGGGGGRRRRQGVLCKNRHYSPSRKRPIYLAFLLKLKGTFEKITESKIRKGGGPCLWVADESCRSQQGE